jgi:hypothetical protein
MIYSTLQLRSTSSFTTKDCMILLPASLMMPDAIDSAPTWLHCVLYNKDIKHAVNSQT